MLWDVLSLSGSRKYFQLIICLTCRARLARQTEGDGQFEGHCGQAEKRPRQYAKRDHGKRDAVCCSQSEHSYDSFRLLSLQILCAAGNKCVFMSHRNR